MMKANVFCPNCGAVNKIEQNYCRFCGLNLRDASRSLQAQLSNDENVRRLKRLKTIKKLSDVASYGLIAVISIGFLFYFYAVLTKMVFSGERVFFGLAVIFLVFQEVMRYIRRINRLRIVEGKAEPRQNESEKRETTKLLEEKPFEPVTSVTENSTELLYAENKTKKLR